MTLYIGPAMTLYIGPAMTLYMGPAMTLYIGPAMTLYIGPATALYMAPATAHYVGRPTTTVVDERASSLGDAVDDAPVRRRRGRGRGAGVNIDSLRRIAARPRREFPTRASSSSIARSRRREHVRVDVERRSSTRRAPRRGATARRRDGRAIGTTRCADDAPARRARVERDAAVHGAEG